MVELSCLSMLIGHQAILELNKTDSEEKRKADMLFLETFEHVKLPQSDIADNLAWIYVADGVLSQKHLDDLTHVAYATVFECDYVVTWNMRHLANDKTVRRVNAVNTTEKYGDIYIATPEFFTGGNIHGKYSSR